MKILLWLILSLCSGILYRMGGTSLGTKWRDCGCPLLFLICLWLLKGLNLGFWWAYLLTFGLMWASLTTYWKKKGTDAQWWNWLVTGLVYGLAAFPLIWCGVSMVAIVIRAVILGLLTMGWSLVIGNADIEELGRGFIFLASTPLLLI